jgi:ABC-type multidrug transport system ATPase subunit
MDIIVENVSYIYKKDLIIKDFNFEIREGSICGIIGNAYYNVLKIMELMAGKIKPSNGRILAISMNSKDKPIKANKSIGYCSRLMNLKSTKTVFEYLKSKGKRYIKDKINLDVKVRELLKFVKIENEDLAVCELSYALKYRFNLALELIKKPEIMIIDLYAVEFDTLDKQTILEIIYKLKGKVTVVFATNYIEDINDSCNKMIIIKNNRILYENTINCINNENKGNVVLIKADGKTNLVTLIKEIEQCDFIEKVSGIMNGKLKIFVSDINKANLILPKIITQNEIELIEYENIREPVEHIYYKVMEKAQF